jgi:hypothetical protein
VAAVAAVAEPVEASLSKPACRSQPVEASPSKPARRSLPKSHLFPQAVLIFIVAWLQSGNRQSLQE